MEFLTVEQIATEYQVTKRTVNRWCALGMLKATRAGRQWRIRRDDLNAFFEAQKGAGRRLGKADGLALAY